VRRKIGKKEVGVEKDRKKKKKKTQGGKKMVVRNRE